MIKSVYLVIIFPLILVGQIIVEPHDILDGTVVNDHIISKIYKGDIDSLDYLNKRAIFVYVRNISGLNSNNPALGQRGGQYNSDGPHRNAETA